MTGEVSPAAMRAHEARTVHDLVAAIEQGDEPAYVHFWGHRPRGEGSIGQECFSQWWPATFEAGGVRFASAEHFMMWRKAMLFNDQATAEEILRAATPAEAKSLGRRVAGFSDAVWEQHRWEIVVQGSLAKFASDPELLAVLQATGDSVIVEAAPNDRIWGIGLSVNDPEAHDPRRWRGLNLLGFALMEARTRLANPGA